jgi:hypothetical protein
MKPLNFISVTESAIKSTSVKNHKIPRRTQNNHFLFKRQLLTPLLFRGGVAGLVRANNNTLTIAVKKTDDSKYTTIPMLFDEPSPPPQAMPDRDTSSRWPRSFTP